MRRLITLLGPTASGKTTLAVALAATLDGEILSADSRQLYRSMDIGTGKDIAEYHYQGRDIPYHLIDICDAGYKYNLYEYQRDFRNAYNDITIRGKYPILCGGTGLYIESVLKGYHLPDVPENSELRARLATYSLSQLAELLATYKSLHNDTDTDTVKRAIRAIEIADYAAGHPLSWGESSSIDSLVIGVDVDRDLRRRRISDRLKARLDEGMVEEVKSLLDSGVSPQDLIYYGLEYKFVTRYVIGELNFDQMYIGLETAIHQFAKRQMTWFRGMERRGIPIHWIEASLPTEEKVARIIALL